MVRGLAKLLSAYGQGVNQQLGRQSAMFQPKTKGKQVDGFFCEATYPQLCFQYIHQNPVRAGLATTLDEWPCSSYQDYAGLRNGSLCNQAAGRIVLDLPMDAGRFIG